MNKKRVIIYMISIIVLLIAITFLISEIVNKNDSNNITQTDNDITSITVSNSELAYSTNRADFSSDEQFANFRQVNTGNIKPIIYRGASTIDMTYNRATITNKLLEKSKINYVIDLTDSEEDFIKLRQYYSLDDTYISNLYNDRKIYFASMGINYNTKEFAENMAKALMQITKNSGPFYIHCVHGRDRTGMACMILEFLADASYQEVLNDYMKTFENYNFVNQDTNIEKYNLILKGRFQKELNYITRDDNIKDYSSYDYKKAVIDYLKYGGLTDAEIANLTECINK